MCVCVDNDDMPHKQSKYRHAALMATLQSSCFPEETINCSINDLLEQAGQLTQQATVTETIDDRVN